jgi:hypothetical protein
LRVRVVPTKREFLHYGPVGKGLNGAREVHLVFCFDALLEAWPPHGPPPADPARLGELHRVGGI